MRVILTLIVFLIIASATWANDDDFETPKDAAPPPDNRVPRRIGLLPVANQADNQVATDLHDIFRPIDDLAPLLGSSGNVQDFSTPKDRPTIATNQLPRQPPPLQFPGHPGEDSPEASSSQRLRRPKRNEDADFQTPEDTKPPTFNYNPRKRPRFEVEADESYHTGSPRSLKQRKSARNDVEYDFDPLIPGIVLNRRYENLGVISAGGFGVVIKALDHQTNTASGEPRTVAIKVLYVDPKYKGREMEISGRKFVINPKPLIINYEIANAQSIGAHCPNSVPIVETFEEDGIRFLVMPYYEQTLNELFSKSTLTADQMRDLAKQLFEVASCMHTDLHLVHNDIKPQNIMIESVNPLQIRLLDFTITCPLSGGVFARWPRSTPYYESPEITMNGRGEYRSDIWSIGLVLAETFYKRPILAYGSDHSYERVYAAMKLTGLDELPWRFQNRGVFNDVAWKRGLDPHIKYAKDNFLDPNEDTPAEWVAYSDLVKQCLQVEAHRRPTAQEALNHRFITETY